MPAESPAASAARPAAILLSRSSFVCKAASACNRIVDAFAPCSIAAVFTSTRCVSRVPSPSAPAPASAAGAGAPLAGAAGAARGGVVVLGEGAGCCAGSAGSGMLPANLAVRRCKKTSYYYYYYYY